MTGNARDRRRRFLEVLNRQDKPLHAARIAFLAGDVRAGHSGTPTLMALERRGLAKGQLGPHTRAIYWAITQAGRDAVGSS